MKHGIRIDISDDGVVKITESLRSEDEDGMDSTHAESDSYSKTMHDKAGLREYVAKAVEGFARTYVSALPEEAKTLFSEPTESKSGSKVVTFTATTAKKAAKHATKPSKKK